MARLDRRSGRETQRRSMRFPHRRDSDENHWSDPDLYDDGQAGYDAALTGMEEPGGGRNFNDLSARLDSLSSQLDRLSGLARDRKREREPVRRTPGIRGENDLATTAGAATVLGDTLSRLSDRLDSLEQTTRPHRRPSGNGSPLSGRSASSGSGSSSPQRRPAANLDTDMQSAVSQIARRQRELEGGSPTGRTDDRSMRNRHAEIPASIERHFSDLADRIDNLRSGPEPDALSHLLSEVGALREEVAKVGAARPHAAPNGAEPTAFREMARTIENLVGSRPIDASVDDLRAEIAALRDSLTSNNVDATVASLRGGYEDILHRLENLQSTVGDPRLYHTIADRLAEVRRAIRAIPQVEQATNIERRIASLADRMETLGERFDSLPFDTLQSQVLEMHDALQSVSPTEAIKDLDWKVRSLADKIDGLEDNLSGSSAVSERMASLEDLIRSRPDANTLTDRLDRIFDRFLEKSGLDTIGELQDRITRLGDKLDLVGNDSNATDMLGALDSRVTDLCVRFDTFNSQFEDFAGSRQEATVGPQIEALTKRFDAFNSQLEEFAVNRSGESVGPQIEALTERIETLADALLEGKSVEPLRRDIADLRKGLADGDRAVVDLAHRIGQIGDRLDRFAIFDGEDGKLGRLSEDLNGLQRQIADGDAVVFEILKRVTALETKLGDSASAAGLARDPNAIAVEVDEIRDRLASGDKTLTTIADRMEALIGNVQSIANEPGVLSELGPVQQDFQSLKSELQEGNKVARSVLDGLTAIDQRLTKLTGSEQENAEIARLSNEVTALRDVVHAMDKATIASLHEQIRDLTGRLETMPGPGTGDAGIANLEAQINAMASKLAATESDIAGLSTIGAKLDQIDARLAEGRQETLSATRAMLDEFAARREQGSQDLDVRSLQSDLQRLQSSATKTDDSFGAVQEALTGLAERLTSLESGDRLEAPTASGRGAPTRRSRRRPAAEDAEPGANDGLDVPSDTDAPFPGPSGLHESNAPLRDDNRPLEPGSGKPKPTGSVVEDRVERIMRSPRGDGKKSRQRAPGDRAEFLAAARRAAKLAATETAVDTEQKDAPKRSWLARAAALGKGKTSDAEKAESRREPQMAQADGKKTDKASRRASVLKDAAAAAAKAAQPETEPALGQTEAQPAVPAARFRKYARTGLVAATALAVAFGGLYVLRNQLTAGGGVQTAETVTPEPSVESAATTGSPSSSAATSTPSAPAAPAGNAAGASPARSADDTANGSLAFAPPSGLEAPIGQGSGSAVQAPRQITPGATGPLANAAPSDGAPSSSTPALGPIAEPTEGPAIPPASSSDGLFATPADKAIGPAALREAAAGGNAFAQFEVASRYMDGSVSRQNLPKAVEWYSKAAGQGFAPAQYRLGSMFEKGLGVPKDLQSARSWYTRAADKGNAKAIHNLAVLHAEGGLGERNFVRAAQWFQRSASHGVTDSQYNLGILYAQGLGIERDLFESYKWFSLAARAGDADAARKRDTVAAELTEEQKSRAMVAVTAWKPEPIDPASNRVPAIPTAWKGASESASAAAGTAPRPSASAPGSSAPLDPAVLIGETQKLLTQRGFDPGPADGKLGPQTANAIKAFERSVGLPETGRISLTLLNALRGQSI